MLFNLLQKSMLAYFIISRSLNPKYNFMLLVPCRHLSICYTTYQCILFLLPHDKCQGKHLSLHMRLPFNFLFVFLKLEIIINREKKKKTCWKRDFMGLKERLQEEKLLLGKIFFGLKRKVARRKAVFGKEIFWA